MKGVLPTMWSASVGTAPNVAQHPKVTSSFWLNFFVNALPRGVSQVCFMDNPLVGLICFVALALPMPPSYGILCLCGLVGSTIGGWVCLPPFGTSQFSVDCNKWTHGLSGFNGMLVGAGVATFTSSVGSDGAIVFTCLLVNMVVVFVTTILCTLLTSCLTTCWASSLDLPTFTMPFNLSTIVALAAIARWSAQARGLQPFRLQAYPLPPWLPGNMNSTALESKEWWNACYPQPLLPLNSGLECASEVVQAGFRGVAQVYFCDSWISGLVLCIAFALCSPIGAVAAIMGSLLGLGTGAVLGAAPTPLHDGLLGYNSVIASMAICGVFFRFSTGTVLLAVIAAIATAMMQATFESFMAPVGLPILTLPFCTTALLVLSAGRGWTTRVSLAEASTAENNSQCRGVAQLQWQSCAVSACMCCRRRTPRVGHEVQPGATYFADTPNTEMEMVRQV